MEVFNNFVAVTLAAPAGSGDATITVAGGYAGLSTTGNYRLLIDSEILLATSRAGNVISILRGQEGTTAAAHAASAQVIPIVTAGALAQLEADAASGVANIQTVTAAGTFAAAPGMHIYVDLDTVGGNVTVQPAGVARGQSFSVKLVGTNVGAFTCTVEPMTGGQIESRSAPGTLTGAGQVMSVPGDELNLESPDGTNLYY